MQSRVDTTLSVVPLLPLPVKAKNIIISSSAIYYTGRAAFEQLLIKTATVFGKSLKLAFMVLDSGANVHSVPSMEWSWAHRKLPPGHVLHTSGGKVPITHECTWNLACHEKGTELPLSLVSTDVIVAENSDSPLVSISKLEESGYFFYPMERELWAPEGNGNFVCIQV